jgi:DNA-binding beta-propeller fold protein YncE
MHMHPRVRELEERFADVLVVIGVHAGKFPAERATPRIRSACGRLGITHPVVNDRQFRIWRSYGVEAWPTIALVTPDGYIVTVRPGESAVEEIAGIISRLADAHRATGDLDSGPRDFGSDPLGSPADDGASSVLRFPGRVLADGQRLYVSDTGHRRVLALRLLEGVACASDTPRAAIESVWGSGREGFEDGQGEHASFREPQGLARNGDTLYVADRTNHAVRAIGLTDGAVTTVAGTGELASWRLTPGPGTATSLRSPWGLATWRGDLVIAMAGAHQLWTLGLDGRGLLAPLSGSGGEDISDGSAARALLAQPTGLAVDGERLHFTDSESSSVRTLHDGDAPRVDTIVGTGLFDFGDRDGTGDAALLQHAEDLAPMGGSLYVTDTYNDKLKVVDLSSRECRALPGGAGSGTGLRGPAGVSAGAGCVWVADTDSHRIVAVDPATGAIRPLVIE